MKIDVLTLFPNMFTGILQESIIKRAIESKKVEIQIKVKNISINTLVITLNIMD